MHPISDWVDVHTWHVGIGGRPPVAVVAVDQFDAWHRVARHLPVERFGLICTARRDDWTDDQTVLIRTSQLFGKFWGDNATARLFIAAAIGRGLGDTSSADLAPEA